MCSACGFPVRPGHWTDAGLDNAGDRRRAGFRRAAVLTRALAPLGLSAHSDGAGLVLSSATGGAVVVSDPAELWPAVERLAGRAYDPLDGL